MNDDDECCPYNKVLNVYNSHLAEVQINTVTTYIGQWDFDLVHMQDHKLLIDFYGSS